MDNFKVDITSIGEDLLIAAMQFVFKGSGPMSSACGYAIRQPTHGKPLRIVFYHVVPTHRDDFRALPFKLDAEGAADFALRWLNGAAEYGAEPDHDGDNEKGWRLYNEDWGHVDGDWQALIAVAPNWAMYGK